MYILTLYISEAKPQVRFGYRVAACDCITARKFSRGFVNAHAPAFSLAFWRVAGNEQCAVADRLAYYNKPYLKRTWIQRHT